MARLSAARRRKLPASKFVYPGRRAYPIDTPGRARAALALSARKSTFGSYAKVAKAVKKRYPGIKTRATKRRSR